MCSGTLTRFSSCHLLHPFHSVKRGDGLDDFTISLRHKRDDITIHDTSTASTKLERALSKAVEVFRLRTYLGSSKERLQACWMINMFNYSRTILLQRTSRSTYWSNLKTISIPVYYNHTSSSSLSLSIWRRKKEMGKEGLIIAKELKRLESSPARLDRFIKSHVSRLLKSDLVSILFEFQRQDLVFLSMKLYEVVRKEIWYRPDMFFYRDMLMMLARNKKANEVNRVWQDLKNEEVHFDQHTFGDIIRTFLDSGLPSQAMCIYDEMRRAPDPPLSLPYRVIMKGLLPYPELRERVKHDFLQLFPDMIVYDPPEDLFEDYYTSSKECSECNN
ncbi:hypothetical protein E3N88_16838 [Mikania micrantha]|uniref:Pentatricopeptide repeat-containing protein n=1 Tax=Mikania micrantha TaxID=192012 RepID=A0A5N6NQ26_9ASTR|nr:hypothetical protein E3N88_16838 [Mikania micrantha]